MGLINLKTDLKSLRYSKDQLGGGYSGQPYIQVPIPDGFNNLQLFNNDFVLRGGGLAIRSTTADVLRLGKMFADLKSPNGLLFIAKQNLLSRTAVRTQTSGGGGIVSDAINNYLNGGIYTPTSTLAQASVLASGYHLNKQGLNPFELTGAYATNNPNLYSVKVPNLQPSDENRLVNLYQAQQINQSSKSFGRGVTLNKGTVNVLSYTGGPGSILGIGNTNIRYAEGQQTGNAEGNAKNKNGWYYGPKTWTAKIPNLLKSGNPRTAEEIYKIQPPDSTFTLFLGSSELPPDNVYQSVSPSASISPTDYFLSLISEDPLLKDQTPQPGVLSDQQFPQNTFAYTQKDIQDVSKDDVGSAKIGKPILQDFRKKLKLQGTQKINAEKSGATPISPAYSGSDSKAYESRVNIGGKNNLGPGNKEGKNLVSYKNGSDIGPVDKINAYPLYQSTSGPSTGTKNDLVKFRIAVINNKSPNLKTFIHFRAFIDNFSDSYNATWSPTTYLGRGENFYTYSNYTRAISMGWTVAAQSKQELIPMYHKLNYLASSLTPYYTEKGYMAGNLVQLTVGGYLYETVGIITSLTYDIPEESPWELGINDAGGNDDSVKELPHVIRVTNFSFTPIQDFIPSLQSNTYSGPDGRISEFGNQQYISLANGDGEDNIKTNYNLSDILAV